MEEVLADEKKNVTWKIETHTNGAPEAARTQHRTGTAVKAVAVLGTGSVR